MDTKQKLLTIERKAILSTLWIFFMLNMIVRDIHELFRAGFLEGVINGSPVTEELLLVGGIMVEIPLAMV